MDQRIDDGVTLLELMLVAVIGIVNNVMSLPQSPNFPMAYRVHSDCGAPG